MRISFTDRLTRRKTTEGSAFTVTAKFFDDATETWTASTPTTVRYRIDSAGNQVITGWTTVTPATSATISVTASENAIINDCAQQERKVLTMQCNAGLATQYQAVYNWAVTNLVGIT